LDHRLSSKKHFSLAPKFVIKSDSTQLLEKDFGSSALHVMVNLQKNLAATKKFLWFLYFHNLSWLIDHRPISKLS
jgi:hypothetical protein